ncbi:ribokinase [Yoonia sediminilitoris]|uniref:Ribokinase n=1 Tax=Yoonia sediminilitoris TaxID=1286148 RepID=A0A2T6KLR9_9RHOB|nr:ribokinase [Yoonia sediminilitoris]PUB17165.1 ribokinase [Yoonia sediminilitoris]RCW97460.1 ribokinase [Yoonia sediminilitoris]
MAIWNLGSINADFVYSVPKIPGPGETLASIDRKLFLGGKGANMSVAAARAGARVNHIGAVGEDGRWAVQRLLEYGVDTRNIIEISTETAQAIIMVDPEGENAILLHPGANVNIPQSTLQTAMAEADTGDWLVIQNETNLQRTAADLGKKMGLKVAYAAAPFDADRVKAVLPYLDFLILNEVEAAQLEQATGKSPAELPLADVIVTLGGKGADWYGRDEKQHFDAIPVTPVDTTGAGDTFTGYVLAALDRGMPMAQAIGQATIAGALMVMRHGTADVIPDLSEVQSFRT